MKTLTGGWPEREEVHKGRVCSGRTSSQVSQRSVRKRQEGGSQSQANQVLPACTVSHTLCVTASPPGLSQGGQHHLWQPKAGMTQEAGSLLQKLL